MNSGPINWMKQKLIVESVEPSPIAAETEEILIKGKNFVEGAKVQIGEASLPTEFVSETELKVSLDELKDRPTAGTQVEVTILQGSDKRSDPYQVTFL